MLAHINEPERGALRDGEGDAPLVKTRAHPIQQRTPPLGDTNTLHGGADRYPCVAGDGPRSEQPPPALGNGGTVIDMATSCRRISVS